MLVLTRKVGEEILIGDRITVKVIEVTGNKVRLGIVAPAEMRIYREEVLEKVRNENRFAATWDMSDYRRVIDIMHKNSGE